MLGRLQARPWPGEFYHKLSFGFMGKIRLFIMRAGYVSLPEYFFFMHLWMNFCAPESLNMHRFDCKFSTVYCEK